MSSRPSPFWLCHECGAQMRPLEVNGVKHCASCNGEFLEILDPEVNPDPYHELPPAPPVRPSTSPPPSGQSRSSLEEEQHAEGGGFMQHLFGSLFGAAASNAGQERAGPDPSSPGGSSAPRTGVSGLGQNQGAGGRTFTWNFPGGGQGRVVFGTMGGQMGGMGQVGGPFGPGGDDGLDAFFSGFGARPGGQQNRAGGLNDPMAGDDLLRGLMEIMSGEPGVMPPFLTGAPQGRANPGDYVMTQQGFDQILEQLMQAAGPQGPIPASEVVIEGLPRITFTEESLEKSVYKDCPVCKEDFTVGDEVMRVPCAHVFHPDCLQPWLKINGSCPVCRFSLVPEDGNRQNPQATQAQAPSGGLTSVTDILQRLWGQGGAPSNPTSPTTEQAPPVNLTSQLSTSVPPPPAPQPSPPPAVQPQSAADTPASTSEGQTEGTPTSGAPVEVDLEGPMLSSAIPADYRERHRQRELERERERERQTQQNSHDPYVDDLD
ncbi:hypothetical protein BCR39DRAFT_555693 [Naematelia encephala]|uniref:RING-type E3 ubiquitin transferase n=1 Tax=Naematelia encephala TaxID=71784 RepID=A0A1Y2BN02_9TREE|nr:hypothetical protein BCR39DRAFT_555693 [Naematelia encephala]